ncbi:MAG: AbrB/MazE/SpoVT family DNA-binding domain-containing protein [Uliginosibacterium sp.]|jgi:antitoxin MazE|nr:AbrB/MazE/SpoVT family DNA-binding domain-containing protein [Uliginosibacterium sp.]MBK9393040.1 AbrB/MazE/SpoVT family DNA-binding domain-containing protein [Uliginosibacterium sp.]MBK9615655.1 AbrB/MazE/SpoVT family DNA-binding domain-containing protein [Uliginosibacterium sp.]
MQISIAKWGNSLAVRIPAELARHLALEEGSTVEIDETVRGTLELVPMNIVAREAWLREHLAQCAARLESQPLTSSTAELLRAAERY